jgi:purine-binding chemotaxis protein CheW
MSNALQPYDASPPPSALSVMGSAQSFVTMRVSGQLFGASVMVVQDVLRAQTIAPVPLAPREVSGSLNLRGRIVTVVDMRARLGLDPFPDPHSVMHIVVEYQDELYSLMVDAVGDVLNLPMIQIEKAPANLEPLWKDVAGGICRLDSELLVLLDIQSILTFQS